VFIICYPAAAPAVGGVGWEASLRECVRGGWGVNRVVVGFVSPVAEDLGECPLVRGGRGFC